MALSLLLIHTRWPNVKLWRFCFYLIWLYHQGFHLVPCNTGFKLVCAKLSTARRVCWWYSIIKSLHLPVALLLLSQAHNKLSSVISSFWEIYMLLWCHSSYKPMYNICNIFICELDINCMWFYYDCAIKFHHYNRCVIFFLFVIKKHINVA